MTENRAGKPKALRRPPVPNGLGAAGKACWRAIWAEVDDSLELDERERLILVEACGVADDLARLDKLVKAAPAAGQLRLLAERRQQRLAYGRLLAQLDLGGNQTAVKPASRRASKAATVRWQAHNEMEARRERIARGQGA